MKGILIFHSETGTEGGYWAFQDAEFMNLPAPDQHRCTRCSRVWDRGRDSEPPPPAFTYYRGPRSENGVNYHAGYYTADSYDPDGDYGPREWDAEFHQRHNEASRQCAEGGHQGWEHLYPDGMSSYEGLHILKSGDHLKVLGKEDETLFDGVLEIPPYQDPYAEGSYAAGGFLTAHSRPPVGTEESWWFDELQAILTRWEWD